MNKHILAAATGLALLSAPVTAQAEPPSFRNPVQHTEKGATCANTLLVVQLTDAVTTRDILRGGGYERDPLAKPFVKSNAGAYGAAILSNVIARIVTRRSPSIMCVAAGVESLFVANNIRTLGRLR